MRSKLSKVIVGPDQEDLPVRQDTPQEGFSGRELDREFVGRVHVRIDFASQHFPCRREGRDDVCELDCAYDHHVQIAAAALIPSRDRTVNECGANAGGQRLEARAQDVGNARGLLEDVTQVFVDRASAIRLILNLVADVPPQQNAGVGESIEFAEHCARRLAGDPCDLAHVQRIVRVQQKKRERVAAVRAEQEVREVAGHGPPLPKDVTLPILQRLSLF